MSALLETLKDAVAYLDSLDGSSDVDSKVEGDVLIVEVESAAAILRRLWHRPMVAALGRPVGLRYLPSGPERGSTWMISTMRRLAP